MKFPESAPMVQDGAMTGEALSRNPPLPRGRVKCGICGRRLMLLMRRETYTCKGCKKTLPRRFAVARMKRDARPVDQTPAATGVKTADPNTEGQQAAPNLAPDQRSNTP
ncbi:hypothetical protein NGTWS0302_24240 [Mycolicibacterium cyprinidarum]|uniref:Uncharacterized protein n=1 Tax=Mycolicibacterium cyprinidarum TaxID=2860311 RepID=A0ABQ4VCN2_9MYCO|nr:hypothetical protein NGTWS0302_24240 [Mycolicibacterium sp. NGTWS0302]GJF17150.1 hypothetical protein NGTWS1702_23130 [Mycolicibacterium sp. NGTWSNA01]